MLENIFAEQVWFAPTKAWIPPGTFLRLGDVGYVTEGGDFRVLGNIHRDPSTNALITSEAPSLEKHSVEPWESSYDFSGGAALKEPIDYTNHTPVAYQELRFVLTPS